MTIVYPPSIRHSEAVKRSFVATNGELAFYPSDAEVFIAACEQAGLAVSRWEVWLANHELSFDLKPVFPVPSKGEWCALIPTLGTTTSLFGGDVTRADGEAWSDYAVRSAREIRDQIASYEFESLVLAKYLEHIRLNFLGQEDQT